MGILDQFIVIIVKNLIRRWFYLMSPVAFLRECALTACDDEGRIKLIAAVKRDDAGAWYSTRIFFAGDSTGYAEDLDDRFRFYNGRIEFVGKH